MTAAPSSTPPRDSIGRFIAGDPLRAIMALTVVAYHVAITTVVTYHAGLEEAYGAVGEYIVRNGANMIFGFFVASGYLLGRPFVRAFVLDRPTPSIRNFARNRLSRIVPAAWVAITVTFMLYGVGGSSNGELLAVYGLFQNYVSSPAQQQVLALWSVDVEALFYVLLPIGALLLMRLYRGRGTQRRRLWIVLGMLAAFIVVSLAWRAGHADQLVELRRLMGLLFALAIGMGLGALEIPGIHWARRLRSPKTIGTAMFVVGAAVVLFAPLGGGGPGSLKRSIGVAAGWALLMGGPLVQQWGGAGALRILDNRAMHAIGRWSYSIYLFHGIVLHEFLTNVDASSAADKIAVTLVPILVCAVAVGALSFHFIEKPFMRFRGVSTQPTDRPRHVPPNVPDAAAP
jgi:peptidoglycan/LPS O-acetylase OafA/YrhL